MVLVVVVVRRAVSDEMGKREVVCGEDDGAFVVASDDSAIAALL